MSLLLLLTANQNVSTKLYLRSTQSNGIGATYYDLDIVAGAASDTAVVDTALNGTEIQFTKTSGGAIAQFISGRAPVGGFTLTNTDISVWLAQSSLLNNAGGRYRIFKRTAAGVETDITGTPFDNGIEATASNAEYTWSGNVTDTVFAEDDRVLLKVYVTNIGVMAMGTVTLNFNAADTLAGDSFLNVYPSVAFKANAGGAITIAHLAIASAEAMGTAVVSPRISATGITSTESIGTAAIATTVNALGLVSGEAIGNSALAPLINVSGVASNESVGSPASLAQINPAAIGSAEAFGATVILPSIGSAGISSTESMGTAAIATTVNALGLVSGEAIGAVALAPSINAASIASNEALGFPASAVHISPVSIGSDEAIGTPAVSSNAPASIASIGIASSEAVGSPTLLAPVINIFQGGHYKPAPKPRDLGYYLIFPQGIASEESFGLPAISILSPAITTLSPAISTISPENSNALRRAKDELMLLFG